MDLKIPGYSDYEDGNIKFSKNTFKKQKKIGEGAFSEVYKGINKLNSKPVAIKVLKKHEDLTEKEWKEDIAREIKIM